MGEPLKAIIPKKERNRTKLDLDEKVNPPENTYRSVDFRPETDFLSQTFSNG
jgi:hypothetical protein